MSKLGRALSESEVPAWDRDEDDMSAGDLGYGLGRRPGGIYEAAGSRFRTPGDRATERPCGIPPFARKGEERSGSIIQFPKQMSLSDTLPPGPGNSGCRPRSSTDTNSELSNGELRQRLLETLQEVEILKTELEASQRQLEGKEEALKILQSMAILGKATSHTQAALQKTVEQKRSLEKEINALQWEIEFDHNRLKNIEESWTQKYDRLNYENAVLTENLKLKTQEIKMLKSENAALNRRCLEALSVLDVTQQQVAQESLRSRTAGSAEVCTLELAVLGACPCPGPGGRPCPCAQMAASSRKLLLQLKHELELLRRSKEEACVMADAFRIAFEQQLMRRSDQALRWTQTDKMWQKAATRISWKHLKEDGFPSERSQKTLGQKLLDLLPSENSSSRTDQHHAQEVFKMLVDLLNDKEEALAHQRKVSYMLAQALEDKDTTSKEKKNSLKETVPCQCPRHEAPQLPAACDPVHPHVQVFSPVACTCATAPPPPAAWCTRTLSRSHSWPSCVSLGRKAS
ncbi:coiled-coil domain-containing protein 125 isoform X2 [Ochotona princeps]|uniref:coiled-coil domain-containing protein 125 isoform X2 n=1 Tax=Ochotona princeps TaxID=9978 RepID=UPI002714E071|nr:coiled-coil domain-containing protein 125 isoform X2 [Ochotona princeps]